MKKIIVISLFTLYSAALSAESLSGNQIIKKSIDISTPDSMISTARQVVHFHTGKQREFLVKSWNKNGNDKMLIEYLKPARVKGDKFLFLKGGNIWVYFSKTGRIRRIASSARKLKMQGSDFSYEDMDMISTLNEDFNASIIKEEKYDAQECYLIKLVPKNKDAYSYSKLLCWINKENFTMVRIEYYIDDKLEKYLVQKDVKQVDQYLIPQTSIMKSTKNDTMTESFTETMEINAQVPDSLFNKNTLNR